MSFSEYDVELAGLQNSHLGFSKSRKFPKNVQNFQYFVVFQIFPININIFKKAYNTLEGNGW